jgi:hypothetical protein
MCGMKWLLAFALCLASACAQGQTAADSAAKNLPAASSKPARPAEEPARRPHASLAFTASDDADSVLLPAFASRSTPQPMRFLRVGLEWSF